MTPARTWAERVNDLGYCEAADDALIELFAECQREALEAGRVEGVELASAVCYARASGYNSTAYVNAFNRLGDELRALKGTP